jgi:amino acid transporter
MGEKDKKDVFVRKASGLVREWSFFDMFGYSSLTVLLLVMWASLVMTYSYYRFPGANLVLSAVSLIPPVLLTTFVITALMSTFPRSGMDYVVISRTLHPSIAWTFVFCHAIIMMAFWQAFVAWWFTSYFTEPLMVSLAYYFRDPNFIQMVQWLLTPAGNWLIAMIFTFFISYLLFIFPMKWYRQVKNLFVILMLVGAAILIITPLMTNPSQFEGTFNNFSSFFGGPSYQQIITEAASAGYKFDVPFDTFGTLAMAAFMWIMCTYPLPGLIGACAGEYKGLSRVKRSYLVVAASVLIGPLLSIPIYYLWPQAVGARWLGSLVYLYNTGGAIPPGIKAIPALFSSLIVPIAAFAILLYISYGFVAGAQALQNQALQFTRFAFSFAFDKLLPEKLTHLHPKWRTPTYLLHIWMIASTVAISLWYFVPRTQLYLASAAWFPIVLLVVDIVAAIFLPYTAPAIYAKSPISKYKIGRVPLITPVAILTLVWNIWLFSFLVQEPVWGYTVFESLMFMAVLIIAMFVLYWIIRAYRARQGIDIDLAFKEMPPE